MRVIGRVLVMDRGDRYCCRCQIILFDGRWYKISKIDLRRDLLTLRPFKWYEKLLFAVRRREWPRDTRGT